MLLEKAQEKAQCKRADETTEQCNHQLEQHQVQEEPAQQRETPMETESRRVLNTYQSDLPSNICLSVDGVMTGVYTVPYTESYRHIDWRVRWLFVHFAL